MINLEDRIQFALEGGDTPAPQGNEGETKGLKPTEVLRELSKQFGVNLFEEVGVKALQEQVTTIKTEANQWKEKWDTTNKQLESIQLEKEALALGFKPDSITEAIALARVNMTEGQSITDGLKKVQEKYAGVFTITQSAGKIHNDGKHEKPPLGGSEVEEYMRKNPQIYGYKK